VDEAPSFTSATTTTFTKGASGKFIVTTTASHRRHHRNRTLPTGVSFMDKGNGRAQLLGTPARGTNGTYP